MTGPTSHSTTGPAEAVRLTVIANKIGSQMDANGAAGAKKKDYEATRRANQPQRSVNVVLGDDCTESDVQRIMEVTVGGDDTW